MYPNCIEKSKTYFIYQHIDVENYKTKTNKNPLIKLLRFQKFRYLQGLTRHRTYSCLAFTKMQMIQGSKKKCIRKH